MTNTYYKGKQVKNNGKEIADRLDNLATCISNGKVNMGLLRDSISDLRYAVSELRKEEDNE